MSADAAQRIRSQVSSPLIGAALMLYFGFVHMAEPSGTDLFGRAAWVFFQTLRIGGVAMAVVAAALMTGHPLALILDAAVTMICGLLFLGTGVAMLLDSGDMVQILINLFCGTSFVSSGMRSWRGYETIAGRQRPTDRSPPTLNEVPRTPQPVWPPSATGSLPGATGSLSASVHSEPDETPTGGYLAALADKKRRQRDDSPP